jgi:acetyl-CoA carboxylase biotin carboxyl carrier protein
MSDGETSNETKLIESVWQEARDLVKRLEGSSVQRFAVQAGETKIEIERNVAAASAPSPLAPRSVSGIRSASAIREAITLPASEAEAAADNRIPVKAPLVGTFYRSSQPGEKPFADVGDTVDADQTVCIVEAMKLMNEVAASHGGTIAEILVENGQWVEFEQVLMYIEPAEA